MPNNNFFNQSSATALVSVYDSHLSKPFDDLTAPRGTYIDERGAYRHYPENQKIASKEGVVYRPNHGLSHNVRVTAKVRDVLKLYNDYHQQAKERFAQFNTPENITKLEIASAFYVACRGSEAGFKPEADSPYQRYRQASSDAFYEYAKKLKKGDEKTPLFTEEELNLYKTVLRDPYFDAEKDKPALTANDENSAKKAVLKAVLSSCHALDLARCFHADKMNHKIEEVLAPLADVNQAQARNQVISLFNNNEIQHILTGTKCVSTLDGAAAPICFHEQPIPGKLFLFRLANTNPNIAIRLVALSEKMKDIAKADQLAVSLNRYAMRNHEQFEQFLSRVENCFSERPKETIDILLQEEKEELKNTSTGRIFKTIRADSVDFWGDFAEELVNPAVNKKELREGGRKAWTVKIKDGKYVAAPTSKEEKRKLPDEAYDEADKKAYTRHQSTSYSNYQAGYNPPYFGHNRVRAELVVGVSFHLDDCKLKRIMVYDSGTVGRPYDFDTKEQADAFIKNRLDNAMYHVSLASLQETGLSGKHRGHNEVMAKLKWGERATITVFSNNLESRLLAQLRAKNLENRLKIKYPHQAITVPINIYPEFSLYSEEHQQEDREAAKNDPELKKYLIMMRLNSGGNLQNELSKDDLNELTNIIKSENGFRFLANYLDDRTFKNVCTKLKPELSDTVQSLDDVRFMLSTSSAEKFNTMLEVFKDQLPKIIKSGEDFGKVLHDLSIEKCMAVCVALKDQLLDIIKDSESFWNALRYLSYEQCAAVCVALKDQLPRIITNVNDFFHAAENYQDEKRRSVMFDALKHLLPGIITSRLDFSRELRYLSVEQCTAVCVALKNQLPNIIKSSEDFLDVLRQFSEKNCKVVCKTFKDQLLDIIAKDDRFFTKFDAEVNSISSKRKIFFEEMASELYPHINSLEAFLCVMRDTRQNEKHDLFENLKDKLPNMIKSGRDFHSVMKHLSENQRNEFYQKIKDRLPSIINDECNYAGSDFQWALTLLNSEQRTEVFNALKKEKLSNIMKSNMAFEATKRLFSIEQRIITLKVLLLNTSEHLNNVFSDPDKFFDHEDDKGEIINTLYTELYALFENPRNLQPPLTPQQTENLNNKRYAALEYVKGVIIKLLGNSEPAQIAADIFEKAKDILSLHRKPPAVAFFGHITKPASLSHPAFLKHKEHWDAQQKPGQSPGAKKQ